MHLPPFTDWAVIVLWQFNLLLSYDRKSYSPQMSHSHIYLVAETTLYILTLRKQSSLCHMVK